MKSAASIHVGREPKYTEKNICAHLRAAKAEARLDEAEQCGHRRCSQNCQWRQEHIAELRAQIAETKKQTKWFRE